MADSQNSSIQFQWTIDNFGIKKPNISKIFPETGIIKWILYLSYLDRDFVSMFLMKIGSDPREVSIKCEFAIIDVNGQQCEPNGILTIFLIFNSIIKNDK